MALMGAVNLGGVDEIDRYLNIRSAFGASFGPDDTLAFRLDTTGTPQVWTLDTPGVWPRQQTYFDERVTFASWSPERPELAFGMDDGGNERQQLYRLDTDDGTITNWTAVDAKHRWGGWSHDGEQFTFASNRRDDAVFDIYTQSRETGGDATRVYTGDGWLSLAGWSPSDDRLLVHKAHSSFDHDVYVLDLDSGSLTHLTDHTDAGVRYQSLAWAPDGEGCYCCTDLDADTLYFARLNTTQPGDLTPVATSDGSAEDPSGHGDENADMQALPGVPEGVGEASGPWNVDGVAVDDDTGRVVYSRNINGYTALTAGEFVDATTIQRFPPPELPAGIAGGVAFDDSADRFAVTVTSDTLNPNIYVVDITTGAARQWTAAPTAGIPPSTFRDSALIHYESFDDLAIPVFFTLPETIPDAGVPVVVDIHGGPESQRRPSFSRVKQYLLAHGYAVFEPNVRGSTGYGRQYTHLDDVEKRMDAVADLNAAADWLTDHPDVDADRIAVKGGSYGGFMVLAALTEYPDRWAAGIDIVGIANFVTFLENTGVWRRDLREAEYGSLDDDRDFLESISPINNADEIAAPLFVLHGRNDPRVPVDEAEQIAEEVADQGLPVQKLIFEDEGHGLSKRKNRIEAYTEMIQFLDTHVKR